MTAPACSTTRRCRDNRAKRRTRPSCSRSSRCSRRRATRPFDGERFLRGELTPVFFGSAMTNFGVEPFLDALRRPGAAAPRAREHRRRDGRSPTSRASRAFVFKIQANMDPSHRDRIAFVRICSGRFARGMEVHPRPHRQAAHPDPAAAVPGAGAHADRRGLLRRHRRPVGRRRSCASATRCAEGAPVEFEGIPRFSPEHFVRVRADRPAEAQAAQEGARAAVRGGRRAALLRPQAPGARSRCSARSACCSSRSPSIGFSRSTARRRLRSAALPTRALARRRAALDRFERSGSSTCVLDVEGRPLVLFDSDWALRQAEEDHPKLRFVAAVQPGRSVRSSA